tara:strand:+ start:8525 stop:10318 length:1794 start_codon:yes stop_codon:yes gene_type:complete
MATEKIIYDIDVNSEGAEQAVKGLNTEMKGLDATFEDVYGDIKPLTGRMGELEDRLYELAQAGDTTSDEFKKLSAETSRLKTVQREVDQQIDRTSRTLNEKFGAAVTTVTSSMILAETAMSMFGIKSKETEALMESLVTTMVVGEALKSLNEVTGVFTSIGNAIKKTTVYSKLATAAQWLYNMALNANPIGAVVIAITALIAGYVLLTSWLDKNTKAEEENAKAIKDTADEMDAQLKSFNDLNDAYDRKTSKMSIAHKQELAMAKALGMSTEEYQKLELQLAKQAKQEADDNINRTINSAAYHAMTVDEKKKHLDILNKDLEAAKQRERDILFAHELKKQQDITDAKNKPNDKLPTAEGLGDDNALTPSGVVPLMGSDEDKEAVDFWAQYQMDANTMTVDQALAEAERERVGRLKKMNDWADIAAKGVNAISMMQTAKFDREDKEGKQDLKSKEKRAKKRFETEKKISLAMALIDGFKAITASLAVAPLVIGAAPNPMGIANLAVTAAMSAANIAAIASTKYSSGGRAQPGGGSSGPAAPTFNVVGQSAPSVDSQTEVSAQEIESRDNSPQRAYVVSTDITTQQALDREIEGQSSIG